MWSAPARATSDSAPSSAPPHKHTTTHGPGLVACHSRASTLLLFCPVSLLLWCATLCLVFLKNIATGTAFPSNGSSNSVPTRSPRSYAQTPRPFLPPPPPIPLPFSLLLDCIVPFVLSFLLFLLSSSLISNQAYWLVSSNSLPARAPLPHLPPSARAANRSGCLPLLRSSGRCSLGCSRQIWRRL